MAVAQIRVAVLVLVALIIAQEVSKRTSAVQERDHERGERLRLESLSQLALRLSAELTPHDVATALEEQLLADGDATVGELAEPFAVAADDTYFADLGIDNPTPIQAATLPDSLAGRDVLGRGRTGSGKTYAFLLPLVARLSTNRSAQPRSPRALILAPTRELVAQIETSLKPLAKAAGLTHLTMIGGVGQGPQVSALRRGVEWFVAARRGTDGRWNCGGSQPNRLKVFAQNGLGSGSVRRRLACRRAMSSRGPNGLVT